MLKEFIISLDNPKQYNLALDLTKRALSIWDNYTDTNKLEYTDTVVGMNRKVAKDILTRILSTVEQELLNPNSQQKEIDHLREELSDPIIAIQDLDWELPNPVSLTFYSIRNLLDKINGQEMTLFGEPQIYVVINQAIDALLQTEIMSDVDINELLKKYKSGT